MYEQSINNIRSFLQVIKVIYIIRKSPLVRSLNLVFLRKNNDETNTFQCGTIGIGTKYDGGNLGNAFLSRLSSIICFFLYYLHLSYLTILH